MSATNHKLRSASNLNLVLLLDDACDALHALEQALDDPAGLAVARRVLRLEQGFPQRELVARCAQLEAALRERCGPAATPDLEVTVRVDGECVAIARFPEAALCALAPARATSLDEEARASASVAAEELIDRFP